MKIEEDEERKNHIDMAVKKSKEFKEKNDAKEAEDSNSGVEEPKEQCTNPHSKRISTSKDVS